MISVFIYRSVIPKKMIFFLSVVTTLDRYVDLCMLLWTGNSAGTNRAPRARAHVNKFLSFVNGFSIFIHEIYVLRWLLLWCTALFSLFARANSIYSKLKKKYENKYYENIFDSGGC